MVSESKACYRAGVIVCKVIKQYTLEKWEIYGQIHLLLILFNCFFFFGYKLGPVTGTNLSFLTCLESIFAHANIYHLMGNMMWLGFAAPKVEDQIGKLNFLLAYLFIGMGSSLGFILIFPKAGLLGASGAIAGIFVMNMFCQKHWWNTLILLIPTSFYFLNQVSYSIFRSQQGVAYVGHLLGGILGLIALITILNKKRASKDNSSEAHIGEPSHHAREVE